MIKGIQTISSIIFIFVMSFAGSCNKKNSSVNPGYVGVCNLETMDAVTYENCMRNYYGDQYGRYGSYNGGYYGSMPNNWYSYNMAIENRDQYERFLEVHTGCNYNMTGLIGLIAGIDSLTCENLLHMAGLVITTRNLTPSTEGYINIVAVAKGTGSRWLSLYPQGYQKAFLSFPATFRLNGSAIEIWSNDLQIIIDGQTSLPTGNLNARVLMKGHTMLSGSLVYSLNGIPYGDNTYYPY